MGKLAPACAEAAIQGRTWRVPDPSWLPSADGRRAERLMGSRHATSSTPRRPPSPHVIRVSILLFQGGACGAASGRMPTGRPRAPRPVRRRPSRSRTTESAYEQRDSTMRTSRVGGRVNANPTISKGYLTAQLGHALRVTHGSAASRRCGPGRGRCGVAALAVLRPPTACPDGRHLLTSPNAERQTESHCSMGSGT